MNLALNTGDVSEGLLRSKQVKQLAGELGVVHQVRLAREYEGWFRVWAGEPGAIRLIDEVWKESFEERFGSHYPTVLATLLFEYLLDAPEWRRWTERQLTDDALPPVNLFEVRFIDARGQGESGRQPTQEIPFAEELPTRHGFPRTVPAALAVLDYFRGAWSSASAKAHELLLNPESGADHGVAQALWLYARTIGPIHPRSRRRHSRRRSGWLTHRSNI